MVPLVIIHHPDVHTRWILSRILPTGVIRCLVVEKEREVLESLAEDTRPGLVICAAPAPSAKNTLVGSVRSRSQVAILCVAHAASLGERAAAFEAGATDYLVMPLSVAKFQHEVITWSRKVHREL